jgi:hypothetical protein
VLSLDIELPAVTAPVAETTSDVDREELEASEEVRPLIEACWFDEEVFDLSVGWSLTWAEPVPE